MWSCWRWLKTKPFDAIETELNNKVDHFIRSAHLTVCNHKTQCYIRQTWKPISADFTRYRNVLPPCIRRQCQLLKHSLQCIVSPVCIVHSVFYNIMHFTKPSLWSPPQCSVYTVYRYFVMYATRKYATIYRNNFIWWPLIKALSDIHALAPVHKEI